MRERGSRARSPLTARAGRLCACIALAGAASALAGCGAATHTVSVGGPPPSSASGSHSATAASTTAASATGEPPKSFVHLGVFRSPTGNIGCMVVPGTARCDIARRSWSAPARPASCASAESFGGGLLVERTGAGRVVCAGDTVRDPASTPLPYGTASQLEGFVCVSRATGMTCTNSASGHGFFISVQSYQLF